MREMETLCQTKCGKSVLTEFMHWMKTLAWYSWDIAFNISCNWIAIKKIITMALTEVSAYKNNGAWRGQTICLMGMKLKCLLFRDYDLCMWTKVSIGSPQSINQSINQQSFNNLSMSEYHKPARRMQKLVSTKLWKFCNTLELLLINKITNQ